MRDGRIIPVLFASGLGNIGADRVLDFIVDFLPSPVEPDRAGRAQR